MSRGVLVEEYRGRIEPGKESVHRRKDNLKKNILILGDSHSIDFLNILNNIVPDDYIVQTIIKHNAQLEDIIVDLRNLTKTFTLSDYVILSGGLTNALRGKGVNDIIGDTLTERNVQVSRSETVSSVNGELVFVVSSFFIR
ncbi:hypothetical protein JTB14_026499 [Gonioctena quinquepunctata]|nr:hypothetical protein JTB14_026499 [Gonioctena quinquepunctata]